MENTYVNPQPLITVAQDLTASFEDLGSLINAKGFTSIAVFIKIDINDSANVQLKAIGRTKETGSDDYLLPIKSVSLSAGTVKVKEGVFEFDSDTDQLLIIEIETGNLIPFIQLQVKVGTVGASAGQIDDALVAKAWS